jgi:anti-sigma regulatory factor (Ser/Thr protein kinase)
VWQPEAKFAGEARKQARKALVEWGVPEEGIDDVSVILAELFSNALIHGTGEITISLCLNPRARMLTGAVEDAGARWPRAGGADLLAVHGRGLAMVALLSTRWGVVRHADDRGKSVWFAYAMDDPPRE